MTVAEIPHILFHSCVSSRRLCALLFLPLLFGCDEDGLSLVADPDAGFVVADAGQVDAGFVPDAEPQPVDAGVEIPPASEAVYIHTGDQLFAYDPQTNQATLVGDFFSDDGQVMSPMVDIAIDRQGRMFGGTLDQEVYQVDPETGRCTFRFMFDDILHGLTFLPDGRLVVAGERVSVVDARTGRMIRELVGQGAAYRTSGDVVGLPDGQLYWTVRGQAGDGVVRLNPDDGNTTYLNEATINKIFGLGYADGNLYGFSSTGFVVTINPANGEVTDQQILDGNWWGATTNPVLW